MTQPIDTVDTGARVLSFDQTSTTGGASHLAIAFDSDRLLPASEGIYRPPSFPLLSAGRPSVELWTESLLVLCDHATCVETGWSCVLGRC